MSVLWIPNKAGKGEMLGGYSTLMVYSILVVLWWAILLLPSSSRSSLIGS